MIAGESTIVIACPADLVYDFVATEFFRNYPRWSPEVIELRALSPGPIRVGAVGQQVRIDYGKRHEAMFRVTDLELGRHIAFEGITSPFTVAYRFDARDAATQVTFTIRLLRLSLMLRPFEGRIRRAVHEGSTQVVRNLKRVLEEEWADADAKR
jgi:hypothetical protein